MEYNKNPSEIILMLLFPSPIKTIQANVSRLGLRLQRILDNVDILLHDVNVMVVVFVLLFVLVIEYDISLRLLNVGLEDFVWRVGQLAPFVQFLLEVMVTNVRVTVRDAHVVSAGFKHTGNLPEHFS